MRAQDSQLQPPQESMRAQDSQNLDFMHD